MKTRIAVSILFIFSLFYFFGCGATITPTSDRYKKTADETAADSASTDNKGGKEKAEEKPIDKKIEQPLKYPNLREDFDITPYKTKLDIVDSAQKSNKVETEMWVEYDRAETKNTNTQLSAKIMQGFRVQVTSTDNLDEANTIKSDVYFKIKLPVYIIYDSPFYKVRAGDFLDMNRAKDLNFKLNQLGYKDTRVVQDSVNIVK